MEQGTTSSADVKRDTAAEHENAAAQEVRSAKKRTMGNRLFDLVVYPTVAFGGVFAFSVWATEKAMFSKGKVRDAFDTLAQTLQHSTPLKKLPVQEGFRKAKSYSMVLVSFLAGTFLIAPIKLFEDRREAITRKFDGVLGTTHDDPSHYAKEPKQSWLSVMGGRVATFGIVLGLALSVGGHIDKGAMQVAGKITGEIPPAMKPELASKKWQRAYVASFEAFYTALCASMVYVLSRTFARKLNQRDELANAQGGTPVADAAQPSAAGGSDASSPGREWKGAVKAEKPREKLASFTRSVDANREAAGALAL